MHRHWHGDGHHRVVVNLISRMTTFLTRFFCSHATWSPCWSPCSGSARHMHMCGNTYENSFLFSMLRSILLCRHRDYARRGTAPIVSSCSSAKGNHCHFLYTSVSKARYVTYVHAYRSVVNRPTKKVRFLEPSHILGYDFTHSILFF